MDHEAVYHDVIVKVLLCSHTDLTVDFPGSRFEISKFCDFPGFHEPLLKVNCNKFKGTKNVDTNSIICTLSKNTE